VRGYSKKGRGDSTLAARIGDPAAVQIE